MALSNGQLLQGNYRIVRLLGQGGMGAVYLAEHTRLQGRLLAIKENTPEPFIDQTTRDQLRDQFYTEAKILAALDHPNLPKVSDYFIEGGVEYLVMDYIEGEELANLLERHLQQQGKPLSEAQVLDWGDQILAALAYMHSRQPHPVIHRDIKPANLILTPDGTVHLVDFGLVKLLTASGQSTAAAMRGMGTPDYTPLEQYPGSQSHTDARTDIYSLGATLYHLLTGAPPANVRDRLLGTATVTSLRQVNPAVSANTEKAILRAIEIKPDDRFQTAAQMRAALAGQASFKGAATPPKQRPGVAMLTGIALLALALLAGAIMMLNGRGAASTAVVVNAVSPSPTSPAAAVAVESDSAALAASLAVADSTPVSTDASQPTATPTRRLPATATPLRLAATALELPPTATPTSVSPTATATARAVASGPTATATPGNYQSAPVLLAPVNGVDASADQRFDWRWDGPPLRADERFQWRLLRSANNEDPIVDRTVTTPGVTVALGSLPAGEYFWTVRIIQVAANGEFSALRGPEATRRPLRWSPPAQNPPTNTPAPPSTNTPAPPPTNTPRPTDTPAPPPTDTPAPPPTNTPWPTNTPVPPPTNTPQPTDTPAPPPSGSFMLPDSERDLRTAGTGGVAGLGLFLLLVVFYSGQRRRRH